MKLGIVGAGMIVKTALDALSQIKSIKLTALFARNLQKAQGFQQQYAIDALYDDYQAFLADPNVEQVYIALPNHLHYQFCKQALLAGKNVICEKPFTPTHAELAELAAIAKQQNRLLLEAITNIHSPAFAFVQAELAHIGEVKLVQANYSQFSSRYRDYEQGIIHPAFDPACCGGALYDINLYNIYLTCALFGEPKSVHYQPTIGHNGIDTSGIALLGYDNFNAVCIGAKDAGSPSHFTVQGTKGTIIINDAPNESRSVIVDLQGQTKTFTLPSNTNRMVAEFKRFETIIENQDIKEAERLLNIALTVAKTLEIARKKAGIAFRV